MPKKKQLYLLSFFVPSALMLILFVVHEIFPFGEQCFLRTDLYHQYAPFMKEFIRKLHSGGSLFYSWNIGLGSNFTALYAYYLASPFNWLALLCPSSLVIEFLSLMLIVKTGLCGLTFAYYLSEHFDTDDLAISFFAIFYAYSAYMAAYSWNVMWLDCLVLAPLIILGLERMVNEGKCFLYVFTLAVCILTNYYISIMICIFLVVYFIALCAMETDHSNLLKNCCHFAAFSLIAGALAAVLLIPVFGALSLTASGNISFPSKLTSYFGIIEMMARHFFAVECEIGLDHWPNIYCGVPVLFFLPLYMMNRKIRTREKLVKTALLFFMLLGFSMNIPNYIWHGFHYPNSLPARQSFLYIILVLTMSYEAYHKIQKTSKAQLNGAFWGATGFILLCQNLITDESFDYKVYYSTLIILALYAVILLVYLKKRLRPVVLFMLTLFLVCLESAANMSITSLTTVRRSDYLANETDYETLVDRVSETDDTLFRVEKDTRKTKNESALADFRSASVFSSTANSYVTKLYETLGLEGSVNAYSYTGATPFTSALLGVKYLLSTNALDEGLYTIVDTENAASIYKCKYTLPIGFMMPSDINELWSSPGPDPIKASNQLATALSRCGSIFDIETDVYSSLASFEVTASTDGYYYVYVTNNSIDDVTVEHPDGSLQTYKNVKRGYILDLGYAKAGETIKLKTDQESETFTADAYHLNEEQLSNCLERLNAEGFVTESFSDTSLKGTVTAKEDGLLTFSIPAETGWYATVDGERVETEAFYSAFLSVPVSAGTHTVELHYMPNGFQVGALISILALAILIGLLYYTIKRAEKLEDEEEEEFFDEISYDSEKESENNASNKAAEAESGSEGPISEETSLEEPIAEEPTSEEPASEEPVYAEPVPEEAPSETNEQKS